MYTKKEVKQMNNAELLTAYRRCCEVLICEVNSRRGETKRTLQNVSRLEEELKQRLNIPAEYIVSMDDRLASSV